jgi:single-strand DNA-binding protein
MQALKNKVQLIGHVARDPEIKETEKGKKWCRLNIGTTEQYRNARGEKISDTQWHQLVAWGKIAEIVERYCKKGSKIAIEGKLNNRSYVDKDGNKKYVTEVVVSELLMLDKANSVVGDNTEPQPKA